LLRRLQIELNLAPGADRKRLAPIFPLEIEMTLGVKVLIGYGALCGLILVAQQTGYGDLLNQIIFVWAYRLIAAACCIGFIFMMWGVAKRPTVTPTRPSAGSRVRRS
jgi:hypothetical protein